jgi:hypothetical protein
MRQLAALALIALAGSLPTLASAEATTQILQQRTPDGSILLTDRPSAGAKTERSWQVRVEDPAAARQRAIDVKAEANLISERIQRSIDQQRRADLEAERLRLARYDIERAADRGDGSYGDSVVLFAPNRVRGLHDRRHHRDMNGPGGHRGPRGSRPGGFKG